ncbi:peptidase S53, partial [Sulfolobus sp. A20-N-F6]
GSWIGNFQIPNGNQNNPFSLSPYGISGYWYVYIEGINEDGLPISFPASLDINSLTINPITPNKEFVVLPYIYVNLFNGTLAYNEYINEALIFNHNATFINSIINKLVVVNGSVDLINSKVMNISVLNAKILNINSSYYHTSTVSITSTPTYIRSSNTTVSTNNLLLPIGILIDVVTIITVFLLRRKGYK